jgi:hypothetical protein
MTQTSISIDDQKDSRSLSKMTPLEQRRQQLSKLCDELDPYLPLSDEIKQKLESFGITEFMDPFTITNKLLVLLDEVNNELKDSEQRPEKTNSPIM